MTTIQRPTIKPNNPCFSSGPCAKRPGWSLDSLKGALLGRSHRAPVSVAKIQQLIEKSKSILGIPKDVKPIVFATVGYSDDEPEPKVRKSIYELVRYKHW